MQKRGGGVFEGELIPQCTLWIPSCTTLAIKNSFSSENQEYTSFRVMMMKILLVSRRRIKTAVNFVTVTCFALRNH